VRADPPPVERPPPSTPLDARRPMAIPTPGTAFAVSGEHTTLGAETQSSEVPALQNGVPRVARYAALPPGTKQPLLVRRRDDAPPSTSSNTRAPAVPEGVGAPPNPDVPPSSPPPSRPAPRSPVPSASRVTGSPHPVSPKRTPPQPYRPAALPPSANRIPVAAQPLSTPRTPASPMTPIARAGAPSSVKLAVSPGTGSESEGPGPNRRPPPPLPSQVKKET
jgi:hypothetical protein